MLHRVIRRQNALLASASVFAIASGGAGWANPMDPTVVAGDVDIAGLGSSLVVIDNNSNRAIIDWDSFSIGLGETTRINQLGAGAAILNRVTGSNLTEIYGTLSSNGQVYLINENGIIVGADGVIDTSGFVASTLDTNDADFLGGGEMVFSGSGDGAISVLGKIRSVSGGDIFLLSREIEIGAEAELSGGHVGLGAGEEILLRPVDSGNGRVSVRAGKGKITNKGKIESVVAELAAAGGNEYALAINNTGVVRATGASTSGGRVTLTAGGAIGNSGTVKARKEVVVRSSQAIRNSGTVAAQDEAAQTGGTVIFEAPDVVLEAGSLLDVSGALGGGRAFVGGGYQGKAQDHAGHAVDIRNAMTVTVAEGAVIDASASAGAGGEVVIWADDATVFKGDIRADAGAGKGGDAEVSGKRTLVFGGSASLIGSAGLGTLLLDPGTVRIVSASGLLPLNMANTYTDAQIAAQLGMGNLNITTAYAGDSISATEDIVIESGVRISWTNFTGGNGAEFNARLTLEAGNDITALGDVMIQNYGSGYGSNGDLSSNAGGVTLSAGRDVLIGSAGATGGVAIGSEFGMTQVTAGRDVLLQGGNARDAFAQIGFLAGSVRGGSVANGSIFVSAKANVGVQGGAGETGDVQPLDGKGFAYAQIGHGGKSSSGYMGDIVGSIVVWAGQGTTGDVTVGTAKAGGVTDYAQIGHGGAFAGGGNLWQDDISGNIDVRAGNNGNVLVGTTFAGSTEGQPTLQSSQIGHGAHIVLNDSQAFGAVSGRIQGTVDVRSDNGPVADRVSTGTGTIQIGADSVTTLTPDDAYVLLSRIGHGAQVVVLGSGLPSNGEVTVTHGAIGTFDAGTQDSPIPFGTNVLALGGSLKVQAVETAKNSAGQTSLALDNVIRSQLGSGATTVAFSLERGDLGATDLRVSEGDVTGSITAGMIGAGGVTVQSGMTSTTEMIGEDGLFARIGHGGMALLRSGDTGYGFDGGDITYTQANVLQSVIRVNVIDPAAVVKVDTSITSGDGMVTGARVSAAIGSGGEAILKTGASLPYTQNPVLEGQAAGRGGDIVFNKGTVWDGIAPQRNVDPSGYDGLGTDIFINQYEGYRGGIAVTSAQTAGTQAITGGLTRSVIGHGSVIDLVTGAGGDAVDLGGHGGRGGDITMTQRTAARDLGGANAAADDEATGLRGTIGLYASMPGDVAIKVDAGVTAGVQGVRDAQSSAVVGHGDVIIASSGRGGNAGAGGSAPTSLEAATDAFAIYPVALYGGRGGNVDIRLNRTDLRYDTYTPRMLIEGGITINATGTVKLSSAVANGTLAVNNASVQSTIGHGMTVAVVAGNGGRGGASAVGVAGTGAYQGVGYNGRDSITPAQSEQDGETFLRLMDFAASNRGGNGGDVRVLLGDITDRMARDGNFYHLTDANSANGADISISVDDATVADALIVTAMVGAGAAEGVGADVASTIGHGFRVTAIGGAGGDGGSANTQFDDNGNSLWADGTGQSDPQGDYDVNFDVIRDGYDETAVQAGVVFVQPDTSGGRGGDVLAVSGAVKGDISINAASRVTVGTTAGHGGSGQVTAQVGHGANMTVLTQAGGMAGTMYEPAPSWQQAVADGGIKNVTFEHLLLDGNKDDAFDLSQVYGGSGVAVDGIALTAADIAARTGTTFRSLLADGTLNATPVTDGIKTSDVTAGVILHDEEADPEFILGKNLNGELIYVKNTDANNAKWGGMAENLQRFGRRVATYDAFAVNGDSVDNGPVFADINGDGAVDLVDFDRDGAFDIVDVDGDGVMDQIDGRANYVVAPTFWGVPYGITGLGVLDYVAVTGKTLSQGDATGGWRLASAVYGTDQAQAYLGANSTSRTETTLVGDFATANGGRGGDAYAITSYLSGDITVNTAVNAKGDAASLVVSANLTDDTTAGSGKDMHRALIGHAGNTIADASGAMADYRAGIASGIVGNTGYMPANGGDAGNYAVTANGGRGGNAVVMQGVARDNDGRWDDVRTENDFLVGNIFINAMNPFAGGSAGAVEIGSFADMDYGDNVAVAQIGHFGGAVAMGGTGGDGASKGGETGTPNDSQTEVANGGAGGAALITQNHLKGSIVLHAGENQADGSVSFKVTAENGAGVSPAGGGNTVLARLGHGRMADAVGGAGGDGNDGQAKGNGGAGGDAAVTQKAILDAPVLVDLVDPVFGFFGNGMKVAAKDGEAAGDIVRAQVGLGDMAWVTGGAGGKGATEWEVKEQINQSADGGAGGDARLEQAGYNLDITLDIGANKTGGPSLEVAAEENATTDLGGDHTLAAIGHGGYGVATGGAGGAGGAAGATDGINSGTSDIVDSDYNYLGQTGMGVDYAIDVRNVATFGTTRRGGAGGDAVLSLNHDGTGYASDRSTLQYGGVQDGAATVAITLNDQITASGTVAGSDGVKVHATGGAGENSSSPMLVNAALLGHSFFGQATGGAGGSGPQASDAPYVITSGDGGDGGDASAATGFVQGDVYVSNITENGGNAGVNQSGTDKDSNIAFEAVNGSSADVVANAITARAGHLVQLGAIGGAGGNAAVEAGAPPAFTATVSAQGGRGGDAAVETGLIGGNITLIAENSVTLLADAGGSGQAATYAALGHKASGEAIAGAGGMGGTAGAQNLYFIYEALREYRARGNDYQWLSVTERNFVQPVFDYFDGDFGALNVFLDALVGTQAQAALNARDDDAVGNTNFTVDSLTGNAHWGGDDAAATLMHILAAAGHGGNAAVRQGVDSGSGQNAVRGDIGVTAMGYDLTDAGRGFSQIAKGSGSGGGAAITQVGHVLEVRAAIGGAGGTLTGGVAGANGIGGNGGDVEIRQGMVTGGVTVDSHHMITIKAQDPGSAAYQVASYVGHRQMVGNEFVALRGGPAAQGGAGGAEVSDKDDGLNGNGGDVTISQLGWISGTDISISTDILLWALYDADDDLGIDIGASAVSSAAGDVTTAIGHQQFIDSVKAGDAGRMASPHAPKGALGLLEGNGGDITIEQTDLGADIDVIAKDGISIKADTATTGGNAAHLVIGHQRTVGASADSDSVQSGTIVAGMGGDSLVEYRLSYQQGDADSGSISISMGQLGDSYDNGDRLVTITSLTEDVDILAQAALGSARVEIGNQQYAMGRTLAAGEVHPAPFLRTAGDSGSIDVRRGTVYGDVLIQTLDRDRANSKEPAKGKQVTVVSKTAQGTAQTQIGHEVEYSFETGRSGYGVNVSALDGKLVEFLRQIDPTTVADSVAGQASFADGRAAVADMEQIVAAMDAAWQHYADRLPVNDQVVETSVSDADRGEVFARKIDAEGLLGQARRVLTDPALTVEVRLARLQTIVKQFRTAYGRFKTVFETIPQASDVVSVYADAGDITLGLGVVRGDVTLLAGRNNDTAAGIVGNDDLVANIFRDKADDADDNLVKITSEATDGAALTEIGHRSFAVNIGGDGGGKHIGGAEDGGVAGDGGSISMANMTSGSVTVEAEEAVLLADVALSGSAELHLGHSERVDNAAGRSDLDAKMGSGGSIETYSSLSGDVRVMANQIASTVDGKDRKLKSNAGPSGTAYVQMGHQVTWINTALADPVEPAALGDGPGNKGANRGGWIDARQDIAGDVHITLGGSRDLIVSAEGIASAQIRLGHAGQGEGAASEGSSGREALTLVGSSGASDSDDGDYVTLVQRVSGDVTIDGVEDLAFREAAVGTHIVQAGHLVEEYARSGQNNAPTGTVAAFGGMVDAYQSVSGDLTFVPSSSFEASIADSANGGMLLGHYAIQSAYSADDGAEPSNFDKSDHGESDYVVKDGFDGPDVLARQFVDGKIQIETGEILLSNGGSQRLQLGHRAEQSVAVDGDETTVQGGTGTANPPVNPFAGQPSGFVVAQSLIGAQDGRILLTAKGAHGQVDAVLVATTGTEGDITLTQALGTGGVQVGHRSTATTSDDTASRVAEGFYSTVQGIGLFQKSGSGVSVQSRGLGADITLTAVQDIELLGPVDGVIQVGHYIEQTGTHYSGAGPTSPVAVNPNSDEAEFDSQLVQLVDADVVIAAGNNVVMTSRDGVTQVGHSSSAGNEWQVEGNRSVTVQALKGDITVQSGLDTAKDAPDGVATAAGDESGLGDDMLLDASAGGTVRIGHNAPAIGIFPNNATQVAVGDIWVRAAGDLHVLKGAIGHGNYDFDSTAVSASNATVEGIAAGLRDRIQGNTTIGAGQNSPNLNSTKVADVLLLDGAKINSGYGGIGGADKGGALRFFLPAREGLTVLAGTVFNDSDSNADAVPVRASNAGNIFTAEGGTDHEHTFALMSDTAAYSDAYIGPGNFAFYFEDPVSASAPETPPVYIFTPTTGRFTGFSVKTRPGQSGGGAMNMGGFGGDAIAETDSTEDENCVTGADGLCVLSENSGAGNPGNIVEDSVAPNGNAQEPTAGQTGAQSGAQTAANFVNSVARSVRALLGGNA